MGIQKQQNKQVKIATAVGRQNQQREKDLQRLSKLRLIDDDFMRCLFKDNIPLAEFVLRIITKNRDLIITGFVTQKDMKRLAGGRSICLDAYGVDSIGKRYNLEIQRQDKGAEPHRARYHSSAMDIENLYSGQEFTDLPDTYTIFIIEKDFYGMGAPVYPIERMNFVTDKSFADGQHILYVNGEYRGECDIGKLMHDFNCTKADDMNFELMAERTRYLKENPKGVSEMCRIMEDMRMEALEEGKREGMQEGLQQTALRMLESGKYLLEEISDISGLSLDEVKKLKTGRTL